VKVPFSEIEKAASAVLEDGSALSTWTDWRLTRHSAFYRRKDGSYTLCLVWHGTNGETMTRTIRGLRPGAL